MVVAVVVEVVVAVEVADAGLLVAEPPAERCGAVVVVIDAQPELLAAAVPGEGFGGADDRCADALRSPFGRPGVQAADLGTVRVSSADSTPIGQSVFGVHPA